MPTATENLTAALNNATARLAEMDAAPLDERARMTYTDGDQTYDWNAYRSSLIAQIKDTRDLMISVQSLDGPFTWVGESGT